MYTPRPVSSASSPPALAWAARVNPDNLTGADSTAVTTVASGGTADAFTGTATLRTAANGINGHSALSLNGTSDFLATTTGGAGLTGDFYVATVVSMVSTAGNQNFLAFGDASDGQRRSMAYISGQYSFIGQGHDLRTVALSAAVTYILEIVVSSGTLTLYVNGVAVGCTSISLTSFSSTILRLGASPGGSEFYSGLLGECFFLGSAIASADRMQLLSYLNQKYVSSSARGPVSRLAGTGLAPTPILIGSDGTVTCIAPLVLSGGIQIGSTLAEEFVIRGGQGGYNVGALVNNSATGFSAWRYMRPGNTGAEMGAVGVSIITPWGNGVDGSMYIEASNAADPTSYGTFRLIQTRFTPFSPKLRMEMEAGGDFVFYDRSDVQIFRIALNGTLSGAGLAVTGSKTATGTATTTFTVTIGTTQANTNYKVNVTPTSLVAAAVFYVSNKTTTTFDVVYLAGLTGAVSFDWALFP